MPCRYAAGPRASSRSGNKITRKETRCKIFRESTDTKNGRPGRAGGCLSRFGRLGTPARAIGARAAQFAERHHVFRAYLLSPRETLKMKSAPALALALGYYDLNRDKPDLALGWLRKAVDEKLLRDYVLYWQAQASLALGQKEVAAEQLPQHSSRFSG